MSYGVELIPAAYDDLEKISLSNRERILRKVQWLAHNFESVTPLALTGSLSGFFKLS